MLDPHRRQDQKAAVADDPIELGTTFGIVPAQPLVVRRTCLAAALTATPPTTACCRWLKIS